MKLEIQNLSRSFGRKEVLRHITLACEGGRIYGIVGPNGCGKSVLLKCICGLLDPTEGTILLDGKKVDHSTVCDLNIGACIEKPAFIEEISGYQNLKYLNSFHKRIDKDEILMWMKRFSLYEDRNAKVMDYSLGMKEKLYIIQAIMERQPLVLMDEVSNSLDKSSKKILHEVLIEQCQSGHLILYVNHDLHEVHEWADEIYEFNDGRLIPCES